MRNEFNPNYWIIDDDPMCNMHLSSVICQINKHAKVEVFNSGMDFVDRVSKVDLCDLPDTVFLDILMPEMDGVQTVYKLREIHPSIFQRLKFVAVTNVVSVKIDALLIELGFIHRLEKPVSIDELNAILM